jgi:hypothetical protein
LARLNTLVEDYKSGAIANAHRATAEALAAQQAAEAQAARAEKQMAESRRQAAEAEAKRAEVARVEAAKLEAAKAAAARAEAARIEAEKTAAAKAEAASKSAGAASLLAKAKGMLKSSKPEVEAIESTIPGKFGGWESGQILTLANGQRWKVDRGQSYYTPAVQNPKVVIVPAAFAGFWMRFPELGAEVRVLLVAE